MKFTTSELDDISQIQEWTLADPYHSEQKNPAWWISGNGSFLSGCVEDDFGRVLYFRLDEEGSLVRLNVQFAPEEVVSKKRVAMTLMKAFPKIVSLVREQFEGLIYASTSPNLIKFLSSLGFQSMDEDYVLKFEDK
jgi:hypothetical protein